MIFYNKLSEVYQLISELSLEMDKLRAQRGGFWAEELRAKSAMVGLVFSIGNALLPALRNLAIAGLGELNKAKKNETT